jgi:hypothetical protein
MGNIHRHITLVKNAPKVMIDVKIIDILHEDRSGTKWQPYR